MDVVIVLSVLLIVLILIGVVSYYMMKKPVVVQPMEDLEDANTGLVDLEDKHTELVDLEEFGMYSGALESWLNNVDPHNMATDVNESVNSTMGYFPYNGRIPIPTPYTLFYPS